MIIHWYSGNIETLKEMIKRKCYFSIGSETIISNHIKKIVQKIPTRQILTETDNPEGPQSIGKETRPTIIKQVAKEIAAIKGKKLKEIGTIVQKNFMRLLPIEI